MNHPEWWGEAEEELSIHVSDFADKITKRLENLKPKDLVARKNPYLFCLRANNDAEQFSASILDAFLSSSEETMFGTLAEQCAVVICRFGKGGIKSTAEGIDIEYVENDTRTIIQVKSGKHWGNSSQRKKMEEYFTKAKRILTQSEDIHVRCIEGLCYGHAKTVSRGNYSTYAGSDFWKEISEWDDAYLAILNIFSIHAQNGLTEAKTASKRFIVAFLKENQISLDNQINWANLVRYVNGK